MKNFLLHGATNCYSSNFGDFLYGDMIHQYLKSRIPDAKVCFFQPSEFFLKYVRGYCNDDVSISNADCIIYIPGGYFGEGHKPRLRDNVIHFLRFMPIGLLGVLKKKRIMIVGIGAGPINSVLLKKAITIICRKAILITTRDDESYTALSELGIRKIYKAADLILTLDVKNSGRETEQIKRISNMCSERKVIFVHYNHDWKAMEIFARTMARFKVNNPEYQVVVGADSILSYEEDIFRKFCSIFGDDVIHYAYDDPFEMIEMIKNVDVVITCKLHVGVVAAMLHKSVVCVAEHPEKTQRFYKRIDELGRFVSLYNCDESIIVDMLEKYKNSPIYIQQSEYDEAEKNWKALESILDEEMF